MDETFTEGGHLPPPNDYESLLNSKIGNYIIEKLIGIGGYGTVFKAYHAFLGTVVAIKVSHPLVGSTENIKAIIRQGYKALPSLTHPNICRILDFGQFTHQNQERFYVALEYIEGKHMGHLPIPQTQSDVNQYVSWWTQVCDGIAYVHQYHYFNYLGFEVTGIYHGDIKPDNIIIDQKTGQPKIVDFLYLGFKLKIDTGTMRPDQELRDITEAMGTAGYMAPEQELKEQISARTEVYALGVTLFRLLTTKPIQRNQTNPFRAGHTPEEISALLDNPYVSLRLCILISKATQINPADRYERVQTMIDTLSALLQKSPETEPAPVESLPIKPSHDAQPSATQWNYRNKELPGGPPPVPARSGP